MRNFCSFADNGGSLVHPTGGRYCYSPIRGCAIFRVRRRGDCVCVPVQDRRFFRRVLPRRRCSQYTAVLLCCFPLRDLNQVHICTRCIHLSTIVRFGPLPKCSVLVKRLLRVFPFVIRKTNYYGLAVLSRTIYVDGTLLSRFRLRHLHKRSYELDAMAGVGSLSLILFMIRLLGTRIRLSHDENS